MTLNYQGQEIDLCGSDGLRICDARSGECSEQTIDFTRSVFMDVFGVRVPVIPPVELIAYKNMLIGENQKIDIAAVKRYTSQL